jgi:Tol biopolymer transport system component
MATTGSGCHGERIVLGEGLAADATLAEIGEVFGPPELVAELAASGDDDTDDEKPTLTSDRLEIFFLSTRPGGPGGGDVWHAERAATTDAWSAPTLVGEISSPSHERSPAISDDGLTLWVASDRPGGQGGLDIWVSSRAARMEAWATPVLVPALNSPGDEIPRPPGQGGQVMPLSYRAPSKSDYQIEIASRTAAGAPWTTPSMLTEVDTASIDVDGFLSADGLVLHFSSDRDHPGDQDLFVARRDEVGRPFAAFAPLMELNTSHTDRDPWLSADGGEIYFSSDRSGALRIYRATRRVPTP